MFLTCFMKLHPEMSYFPANSNGGWYDPLMSSNRILISIFKIITFYLTPCLSNDCKSSFAMFLTTTVRCNSKCKLINPFWLLSNHIIYQWVLNRHYLFCSLLLTSSGGAFSRKVRDVIVLIVAPASQYWALQVRAAAEADGRGAGCDSYQLLGLVKRVF